ncbi:MAG TPA: hypothetical protein VNJ08_03315, partial [Bacteriovoracaceae bacterium]|nr:hypothetical protein [Bacteriovoracaceae bacterium]
MKNLHEIKEETWQFNSQAMMSGVIREVPDPREIFLLLHGLNERGKKIFRKLNSYLPSDALILAPNGIFPLADQNESGLRLGYTWYYY